MATCSDFWEGVLKLLNFALGTLGLIMLGYGVYLLVELSQISGEDENISELFQLSRNLLMELGFPNNFVNKLSKTWYYHLTIILKSGQIFLIFFIILLIFLYLYQ